MASLASPLDRSTQVYYTQDLTVHKGNGLLTSSQKDNNTGFDRKKKKCQLRERGAYRYLACWIPSSFAFLQQIPFRLLWSTRPPISLIHSREQNSQRYKSFPYKSSGTSYCKTKKKQPQLTWTDILLVNFHTGRCLNIFYDVLFI